MTPTSDALLTGMGLKPREYHGPLVCSRCHDPRCTSVHLFGTRYRPASTNGPEGERPPNVACDRCGRTDSFMVYECDKHLEAPGPSEGARLPVCPHCGQVKNVWEGDTGVSEHDGEESEVTCWKCERTFKVTTHVEYTFDSGPL